MSDDFFLNARRLYGSFLTLFYLKNKDNNLKLAIVVPKKLVPHAVLRNKYKRLIKKNVLPYLSNTNSLNLFFSLNKKINLEEDLKKDLENIFLRLK